MGSMIVHRVEALPPIASVELPLHILFDRVPRRANCERDNDKVIINEVVAKENLDMRR